MNCSCKLNNRWACLPFRGTWVHHRFLWGSIIRVTRSLVLCVCFVDCCLLFSPFSFGHYVVCSLAFSSSSLLEYYLQTVMYDGWTQTIRMPKVMWALTNICKLNNYHMFGHCIHMFTIFLNINHGRQPLNYFKISKWKGIGVINKDLLTERKSYMCIYLE